MPTINDFASLKVHSKDMDEELKAVFAKYGLTMENRRASMGSSTISYKIELGYGSDEQKEKKAKQTFAMYAKLDGLDPEAFGKTYSLGGTRFKVVGYNPSKPKNCIQLERVSDGKHFQCSTQNLKAGREVA